MRQMQVFAFFQVIVRCRGLAAILVMLAGMAPAMAQTQSLDSSNPVNEVIVKSGHFMVRDHLVIDLQHGVEWMRCSVGQIWNGTDCEGVAVQIDARRCGEGDRHCECAIGARLAFAKPCRTRRSGLQRLRASKDRA